MNRATWLRLSALMLALGLVAAACGDSDDGEGDGGTETTAAPETTGGTDTTTTPETTAAAGETTTSGEAAGGGGAAGGALAGVCPETVIFQTDWNPEAEHGALYEMVGKEGYTVDSNNFVVTGDLVSGGEDTGVDIEVRTGGPAIGFQQVTAQMYQDTAIHFGYVSTDEAIENHADLPTIGVVAPLDKNPQIIMWDPATYPEVTTIAQLKDQESPVTIRFFETASYMPYLIASGQVTEAQLDGSYDGTPAVFVAEGGAIAQQGFASAEPYIYMNEITEWGKPVAFQLIHDTGYELYSQSISVRAEAFEELTPCMELLVPIIQQAQVDYITDPAASNALILEAVEAYDNGWVYTEGVADFSVEQQLELGLVGNGSDETLGNFDEARVQGVIDIIVRDVFPDVTGVTAADIVTNEFIDPSIGL
jgi:hypothetical protein